MDTADEFGSLFDEIPATGSVAPIAHTAAWGDEMSYEFEGDDRFVGPNTPHPGLGHTMVPGWPEADVAAPVTLDDDPDAALPVTYGEEDADRDEWRTAHRTIEAPEHMAAKIAAALAAPAGTVTRVARESDEERGRRLLAYSDAVARGEQPAGPNPFAHVSAGTVDTEIAAAAAQHVAKTALKTYDPQERQAIIDEGLDVRASNLDRLDISGTHYEAIEAHAGRVVPDDEDLTFLDGDPNLGDI